jgi:hypothetical protein
MGLKLFTYSMRITILHPFFSKIAVAAGSPAANPYLSASAAASPYNRQDNTIRTIRPKKSTEKK